MLNGFVQKCSNCGKEFTVYNCKDYIYKNKGKYYCCYTCYREGGN